MSSYEILIRNAQLLSAPGKKKSIAVAGGKIVAVAEKIEGQASIEIDAKGMLVSESFVNPHLHLCKVYTLQMMDEKALLDYHAAEMGKAMTAIELAARVKDKYDESWIIKNVRRAIAQAALFGCTHVRAFADVDTKARLEGVKALIRAREEFKDIVDIQIVAFAQDGI
ncbi:MAG: cytosine deaminase, partial [Anaerolineales bacterium]|nr:cytosine deaminase [Anaerolineales bacterium]